MRKKEAKGGKKKMTGGREISFTKRVIASKQKKETKNGSRKMVVINGEAERREGGEKKNLVANGGGNISRGATSCKSPVDHYATGTEAEELQGKKRRPFELGKNQYGKKNWKPCYPSGKSVG